MRHTYTNRYFDFVLIAITFLFSLDGILSLFREVEYFSNYLLRISFTMVSVIALNSLVVKNQDGERYSRFFIIIVLIIPAISVCIQYLTDLLFYGMNRPELLQSPLLYVKLIPGIALLILSLRFSEKQEIDRMRDYGILTVLIGVFMLILVVARVLESNSKSITDPGVIVKLIVSSLIVFFGYRLMNKKTGFKTCLGLTLIFAFIYGLA